MAAETHTEPLKFTIDDVEYEIPQIDDLDMDEWQIVYDYSGLILDDFLSLTPALAALRRETVALAAAADKLPEGSDDRAAADAAAENALSRLTAAAEALDEDVREAERARQRKLAQPAFTKALLHIGYRRAHPELKADAIGKLVGGANLVRVTTAIHEAQAEEEPKLPLALTPELAPSLLRVSPGSRSSESEDSRPSSDERDDERATTGTVG